MQIVPKHGVGKLLFGMKQQDVISVSGSPDKQYKDEDGNVIFLYNNEKLRLTFYEDEEMRLGYIITSNPEAMLLEGKVIGSDVESLKSRLQQKGFKSWEKETIDMSTNHFNEANWVILEEEFGEVIKVELGAIIKDNDEFDWKFGK